MSLIIKNTLICYFCFCLVNSVEHRSSDMTLSARSDDNYIYLGLGAKGYSLRHNHPYDSNEENKGLLAAVVHQARGGHMILPKHFQIWTDFEVLQEFLENLQPGRIVMITLRGELIYKLPSHVRDYLVKSGSFAAHFLGKDVRWTWIFIKGGKTILESVSFKKKEEDKLKPIECNLKVLRSALYDICPQWPNSTRWNQRREFCDNFELYGDLCDCNSPFTLKETTEEVESDQLKTAVKSVIALRPQLLFRSLKSLFQNRGFSKSNLRVFIPISDSVREMKLLLRLLQIPLTISDVDAKGDANSILRQYIYVIKYVLRHHRSEGFFVFLEDDVLYSPDFYIFLNRTTQLLREDESLYCSSAHNDISYAHTSYDARAVLRTESYPNCGWMVRREFVEKLSELETLQESEADWDMVAFHYLRGNRECVIPEVSRSQHFGLEGAHVNSLKARLLFSSKNFNKDPNVLVQNVHRLKKETYETYLRNLLLRSESMDIRLHPPCSSRFYNFLDHSEHQVIAIYFQMKSLQHFINNKEYTILAECLNIYSNSARESHFGLFRLRWREKHLLLIGSPASPYSKYQPKDVDVLLSDDQLLEAAQRHSRQRIPLQANQFRNHLQFINLFFH